MISFGSPPAIKYDTTTGILTVKVSKPSDSKTVLERIIQQLQHVKEANVCLSGGIDSQFALRVATQLNVPVTAYTYLAMWEGSPINADDVITAELVAKKYNVPLQRVELDLHKFFTSGEHLEYSKKYNIKSPQIAAHLYFLKNTFANTNGTVFMGGEVPLMVKNSDASEGPLDIAGINGSFLASNTSGYRKICNEFNIDLVKDLPLYTPEIIYQTLEVSIDVVKKYQIHCEKTSEQFVHMYAHKLKSAVYEEILPGGVNTLMKGTGFEKLKKYLASKTGVYNQFDLMYRTPIEEQYNKTQEKLLGTVEKSNKLLIGNDSMKGTVKFSAGKLPQELTEKYREAIAKYNSKCVYEYFFDF